MINLSDRWWMSISDDDICSGCKHLLYRPGMLSHCTAMAKSPIDIKYTVNPDGYILDCNKYEPCHNNIAFVNIRIAKELWKELGSVAFNEDEMSEEQFVHFPVGTHREEIWLWFEDTFRIPVHDLMFGRVP